MPFLRHPSTAAHDNSSSEHGIAMVVFALWVIVILGFGAYAIDTSRVYNEQAELRNGADAAALAIARDCGLGRCDGYYDEWTMAEQYSDANALDGWSWVEDVEIDLAGQTVSVDVATEDPGGDNDFDMVLAQVVGYDGLTVRADATVRWGAPSGLTSLPLTFSKCEWDAFGAPGFVDEVADGFLHRPSAVMNDRLPPTPGYPYADKFVTIFFHGTSVCDGSPSGQDLPGGFGWLDPDYGCDLTSSLGDWLIIDPGTSPSSGCSPGGVAAMVGTVQLIPYFNDVVGTGNNAEYHIHGYGAIYITGYNFGGGYKVDSIIDGKPVCEGSLRCIEGYMIGDWVASGSTSGIGGGDYGVVVLELID